MSKGSPRVVIRFPRPLLEAVERQVAKLNETSPAAPPDLSEFVRKAVEEKIDHYRRSRAGRRRVSDTPLAERPLGWSLLLKGGRS